jgi:esterase/lipase
MQSRGQAAQDYDDAMERAAALQARDDASVNPAARSAVLTHGQRAERSVVFFHGLTNCPLQFAQLGERFFERGYNVIIPRLPRHGLANRLCDEPGGLTAEELLAATDEAIDIAAGLGERVTVSGLSLGGVLSAWAAQERDDIERAALISPAFSMLNWPMGVMKPLSAAARILPNRFMWWDSKRQMDAGPLHAYPRFSTRALAEVFRIAAYVYDQAAQQRPAARLIQVFTNDKDTSVSTPAIEQMVQRWRARGADVRAYRFTDLAVAHDMIDPDQPDQEIDKVYPILVEQVCGV